jgi:nitrite reductase/ring-hydroxylating ferredoxin subunit
MMTLIGCMKVERISELDDAGQFCRRVGDHDILVFRRDGVIRAFSNLCPHIGGLVGYYQAKDRHFTCLWDSLQFKSDIGRCVLVPGPELRVPRTRSAFSARSHPACVA